jgi:hypothetical protein
MLLASQAKKEREIASHGSFSFEWDTDDVAG